jgi:NAD dependent epimerase/dehydratase family enzyme
MHSVAITGVSGLVGKALARSLEQAGVNVTKLQRSGSHQDPGARQNRRKQVAGWNPDTGEIALLENEMPEAIVHLAGENIAGQRWT